MSATKKSISLPEELYQRAVDRQREFGYATFSDYIQAVVRADLLSGDREHRRAVEPLAAPERERQTSKKPSHKIQ